ncbi:MAG: hypothetical protein OZX49_02212 [Immundisolibacter sp.]|nr:hypothetical protein [Immundisolibacter sp.]
MTLPSTRSGSTSPDRRPRPAAAWNNSCVAGVAVASFMTTASPLAMARAVGVWWASAVSQCACR